MPHLFAHAIGIATAALAVAGMGYYLASLLAVRIVLREWRRTRPACAAGTTISAAGTAIGDSPEPAHRPGVSVLKSLKGLDPGMMEAFRSHCRQQYTGQFELLFGVSAPEDPAADAVRALAAEFPERKIQLVLCPEHLGANGKVSTLVQLARHARFEILLINDSDITVGPHYLEDIARCFARAADGQNEPPVGLVTALYRGRAHGTLGSRFEAMGIATDFIPGVLLSKWIEGGLHYGLGSTLAVRREALEKAGGLLGLVDQLADDYEMGARVARAGYRVALSAEVVETSVPAYNWRAFRDHQLRWLRTVRDARPGGYMGLVFTQGLVWALVNAAVCGGSTASLGLLAVSFFLRMAQAAAVSLAILDDRDRLADLWLLPLRDTVAMGLWLSGFAGNTILWRGQRFRLRHGILEKMERN